MGRGMTLSRNDERLAPLGRPAAARAPGRGWLLILSLAAFLAAAVFFAAGAAAVAGPVALVVLLLGAASAVLLYRAGERAAVGAAGGAAALANHDKSAAQAAFLRAERDRLADLVDHLPVGCFSAAPDGRLTYVNETLAAWLGRSAAELADGAAHLREIVARARDDGDGPGESIDASDEIAGAEVTLPGDGETLHAWFAQNVARLDGEAGHTRSVVWNALPTAEWIRAEPVASGGFKRLFEASPLSLALVGADGGVAECNRAFRAMVGDADGTVAGRPLIKLIDQVDRVAVDRLLAAALASAGNQPPLEVRIGPLSEAVATLYANRLEDADGAAAGVMLHLIDATGQKNLELQFAQSQKMQAVGQLAGGIAHDFNNLITAMMGFCDLLLMRHQAGDPSFADIMQIKQNANRAAGLVRQLLAFSRRQTLQPRVLALTDVLAELTNLLRRLIGENIELRMVHSRNLGLVKVDQGQIEQVIINLAVNARDAMSDGGTLTIRTSNVTRDTATRLEDELLEAGDYVLIEVADTGKGIPKDDHGKIFEPFFSTKAVGAGTGLGLSTVYGIIKQTGGYVFINSAPGEGARFSIFLPRYFPPESETVEAPAEIRRAPALDLTGKGTVLLVEDEDGVRVFGARALRNKGYTVLEANSGEAALAVMESYTGEIDLLVTDVVMPRMDGATLIERVRERQPDFKVIMISGYAEDSFRERLDATKNVNFLPKPFSLAQLAGMVKEVLEA